MHYYVFFPHFLLHEGKRAQNYSKNQMTLFYQNPQKNKKCWKMKPILFMNCKRNYILVYFMYRVRCSQIVKKETPSWEKVQSRKTCVGTIQMISLCCFLQPMHVIHVFLEAGTLQSIKLMYIPKRLRRKTGVLELFAHLIFSYR